MLPYQVLIVYKFNGAVSTSIATFATSGQAEQAIGILEAEDDSLPPSSKLETVKLWKGAK
jgi:hypothetical protein